MPALKRGTVVRRPDKWEQRGRYKHGKAIVMQATKTRVVLCTFTPGVKMGYDNPHVSYYKPKGLVPIGKVKKMPKACTATWNRKKDFYDQHPYFKENPHSLAGARRTRRRRR